MIDADVAFHRAIYAASRNPLIEPSAHVHWHHIQRAMGVVLQRSALRTTVWDEHAAIAEEIAAGNAAGAAELISGHDQRAAEHMRRELAPWPPQPSTATHGGPHR
jgi:DNA-binding GntR family transcriptional regulator